MSKNNVEDLLGDYVASQEGNAPKEIKATPMPEFGPIPADEVAEAPKKAKKKSAYEELEEARKEKNEELQEVQRSTGLGYLPLKVEDLPSRGMFYPEGTKIFIRAASGGEIRHWSMTNEEDLSEIDDALNYMLERCMSMSSPSNPHMGWKDLKDLDRLYVILAIRDFTFTQGNNELKIKINETREEVVSKDCIEFVNFPKNLLNKYNPEGRCFTFVNKDNGRKLNIYLPCVGVSSWIKSYVMKKNRKNEGFDRDFVTIAPLLIRDYRNLNDSTYEQFMANCSEFGIWEYSLISKIKEIFNESLDPKFRYKDEDGADLTAPLNFRGGIKGIFLLEMDDLFE